MTVEFERRQSGVWSVLYQPEISPATIDKFHKMFNFLTNDVITIERFRAMKARNMACIQVTQAFTDPLNKILNGEGFIVDNGSVLSFKEKLESNGSAQSGQNVLRIREKNDNAHVAIVDPACYLYDIPYESLPIAVGKHGFIERAMSELYSNATGQTVDTKLISF